MRACSKIRSWGASASTRSALPSSARANGIRFAGSSWRSSQPLARHPGDGSLITRDGPAMKALSRRHGLRPSPVVKAAARFLAGPARLDIFDEQRRGAEFGIAGAGVKHADDFEAGVEPDEIGERDRPHRMVEA